VALQRQTNAQDQRREKSLNIFLATPCPGRWILMLDGPSLHAQDPNCLFLSIRIFLNDAGQTKQYAKTA
jgi:hypothetical protein